MLKLFVRYVIGGRSGKREAAWAVCIFVASVAAVAISAELSGRNMALTFSFLTIAFPSAVALLAGAHGLEHMQPEGRKGE